MQKTSPIVPSTFCSYISAANSFQHSMLSSWPGKMAHGLNANTIWLYQVAASKHVFSLQLAPSAVAPVQQAYEEMPLLSRCVDKWWRLKCTSGNFADSVLQKLVLNTRQLSLPVTKKKTFPFTVKTWASWVGWRREGLHRVGSLQK